MNVLNQVIENRYALYQGDCVEVVRGVPDNSLHYSIFSPPPLPVSIHIPTVTGIWAIAGTRQNFRSIFCTW